MNLRQPVYLGTFESQESAAKAVDWMQRRVNNDSGLFYLFINFQRSWRRRISSSIFRIWLPSKHGVGQTRQEQSNSDFSEKGLEFALSSGYIEQQHLTRRFEVGTNGVIET